MFFTIGVFFLYGAITWAPFKSNNDVLYIKGPFESYQYHRGGKNASFTFHLKNYANYFSLNIDYLYLLKLNDFARIKVGDTLNIGILIPAKDGLNVEDKPVYVYAIADKKEMYLDPGQTIKEYKVRNPILFAIPMFVCAGLCVFYEYRSNKNN